MVERFVSLDEHLVCALAVLNHQQILVERLTADRRRHQHQLFDALAHAYDTNPELAAGLAPEAILQAALARSTGPIRPLDRFDGAQSVASRADHGASSST